jgi:hypothetical protein
MPLARLIDSVGGNPVERGASQKGALVFAKACELDVEGMCRRQLLQEREKPQLAEDKERGFRQKVSIEFEARRRFACLASARR